MQTDDFFRPDDLKAASRNIAYVEFLTFALRHPLSKIGKQEEIKKEGRVRHLDLAESRENPAKPKFCATGGKAQGNLIEKEE